MAASTSAQAGRPVVVVVEDETDVRNLVAFNLRAADLDVVSVDSLAAAIEEIERRPPAVVIIDRMLPDGDGIDLCTRIRGNPQMSDVGLLVLTALGSEHDRVAGRAAGADDYVVKPFSVRELVARVRLLVTVGMDRRVARANGRTEEVFRWRDLLVEVGTHRVVADGVEVELRPLEFKLLVALFRARGSLVSRNDLLLAVWGSELPSRSRVVDVHVWRLRERLGQHGAVIATVHGAGYRLAEE